jgi:hypothetical protein
MGPIEIIIAALVAGAVAGLESTAEQSIKDAYANLKNLLQSKYASVNIDLLENDPASEFRQGVIREDLMRTKASKDEEILRHAQALLIIVQDRAPETLSKIRINLGTTEVSRSFRIKDIDVRKGGDVEINSEELSVGGDFEIGGLMAGEGTNPKDLGQ